MEQINRPEFRLRLFLSVDLVGSTAFKSKQRADSIEWVKAFQKFYGEFPAQYIRNYKTLCSRRSQLSEMEICYHPIVWKTIGDEILFVNKIHSVVHLGVYIEAFCLTLKAFGREVQSFSLNTKGNGWIAAFPVPNRSIKLATGSSDPLVGDDDILTEEIEAKVDFAPNEYDFLGKEIDGGFRISKNSTIDDLTICPSLAYLLCSAKRNFDTTGFECDFKFHELQKFKGVVNGADYPVISLSTDRDERYKELRALEAKLLNRIDSADIESLLNYLSKFLEYHGMEQPKLRLTSRHDDVEPPNYYKEYIKQWRSGLEDIKALRRSEQSTMEEGEVSDKSSSNLADKLSSTHENALSTLRESREAKKI